MGGRCCSIAATALMLGPLLLAVGAPAVAASTGAGERDGLDREIGRLEAELAELGQRELGVLGRLERAAAEVRLHEAELQLVVLREAEVQALLVQRVSRIEALDREQARRRRYLAFRLREAYKAGPRRDLLRLIPGDTSADLWRGLRYAAFVSERDARQIEAFRAEATALGREREALAGELGELVRARAETERKRARLAGALHEQTRFLDSIRRDQELRRVAVAELQTAADDLGRLVGALAPEERRGLDVRKFRGLLDWPSEGRVAAGFGSVTHERFKTTVPHPGLDISAEYGSAIKSVFDGRVVFAGWLRGYGLTALVDHGSGVLTVYAHASVLEVTLDEPVLRGQTIGRVGDSASLRGPYLYFELRVDETPTDPRGWLRRR